MYRIEIVKSAKKELSALPKKYLQIVIDHISELANNPRPNGYIQLKGTKEKRFRIRVGPFRVCYEINDDVLLITVLKIGDRKEI